ncbi:hypothetical protein ZHAWSFBX_CDS_0013 [Agrobacterium phage Alfirin]|nr:hypothetical protein ZHAWSFBX_CDS_0013 [Agrobacterium phage Alfirin]
MVSSNGGTGLVMALGWRNDSMRWPCGSLCAACVAHNQLQTRR